MIGLFPFDFGENLIFVLTSSLFLDPLSVIQTAEYLYKLHQFLRSIKAADTKFQDQLFRGERIIYDISYYAQIIEKSQHISEVESTLSKLLCIAHDYGKALRTELDKWEGRFISGESKSNASKEADKIEAGSDSTAAARFWLAIARS